MSISRSKMLTRDYCTATNILMSNTQTALEISDRRIAYLVSKGEDVRGTVAWRDAMAERRMINFRASTKAVAS